MVAEHGSTWWNCVTDDDTNQENKDTEGTLCKSMIENKITTAPYNNERILYNVLCLVVPIQNHKGMSSRKKDVDIILHFFVISIYEYLVY
jgi:hypothetical protein